MTRIGIDYTAAARQRAGIGRYTRELVTTLLALESAHQYIIFAATGGLDPGCWNLETEKLQESSIQYPASSIQRSASSLQFRTLPLSDDWIARLWHRLRLPISVEAITGSLDVFYSPDFVLPPTRRATRTLLTVHDLSYLHYPEHFVPKLVRYLDRAVSRSVARADQVLADSKATRADLIAHLGTPPEKVEVLYGGVDSRFRPEKEPGENEHLCARYGLSEGCYVLSVGTIQPRKNYERLVQAFSQVRAPDLSLVIAGGKGWLYEKLFQQVKELNMQDRVQFTGYIDDIDLPLVYNLAEVFVFPSLYEGFGIPPLEAMSCGVPVVAADNSSLPEAVGDAGLLVDAEDVEALAAALTQVLDDTALRQTLIERGLAHAKKFTWERAARTLLATYEHVVEI